VAALLKDFQGDAAAASVEACDATPANLDARTQTAQLASGLRVALLPKGSRGQVVQAQLRLKFGDVNSLKNQQAVVAMLGALVQWIRASGQIDGELASPFHDSPFYDVYECADGRCLTIGALEPQFYALLLSRLGLTDVAAAAQYDRAQWPALKTRFAELFRSRPRDAWCELLEGSDVCFAPVLSIAEAAAHPHNVARGIYAVSPSGAVKVAGAPRFTPLPTKPRG